MTITLLFLKKIFGDFVKGWMFKALLILILLTVALLTTKCSYDNYQNRQEAQRLNTIDVLQGTNKDLVDTALNIKKSQDIDNKAVNDAIIEKDKLKEKTSVAKVRKETKVKTIETKYSTKIDKAKQSKQNTEDKAAVVESLEKEKAIEVSAAHLDHLWSVFCDATNQGSSCTAGATT